MTRQTWEEERDARIVAETERLLLRILLLLEEILRRLPPPPTYSKPIGVIVTPVEQKTQA